MSHEFYPVLIETDGSMSEFDLSGVEENFADLDFNHDIPVSRYSNTIDQISLKYCSYFDKARERLMKKIDDRMFDLNENLDIQIDPEVEKVRESYRRQIKELEEKLDLQESQMKWYGKDMKSAITRTRNKMLKARTEMESLVTEYRGYYGIKYNIKLVGAAVIISPE